MALRYTDEAEADLMAIVDYGFEQDLPDPIGYVLTIRDRVEQLHNTNMRGRASAAIKGAREWVVPPYVVFFYEHGKSADVLRVLDSRRQFP